jgi:hypothetical protein
LRPICSPPTPPRSSPATWSWRSSTPASAARAARSWSRPTAARLARGERPPGPEAAPTRHSDWPDDLAAIVYLDRYGNALTGLRAARLADGTGLEVAGRRLSRARTFTDVPRGAALWYENANGLAEIAVSGGSAAARFGLVPGSPVRLHPPA